jgi:hypothetical protein
LSPNTAVRESSISSLTCYFVGRFVEPAAAGWERKLGQKLERLPANIAEAATDLDPVAMPNVNLLAAAMTNKRNRVCRRGITGA